MKRTLISILLLCAAFPFGAKTEHKSMSSIEFDRWNSVTPFLCCEVNETDTVWTLEIWGRFIDEDDKMRINTESSWKKKVWKKDELGKNMTQAYRIIMERLSPDYVPSKKKTIYDDF